MKDEREIPVSDTDELTVAGGRETDHTRRLSDFKPTNTPLSATEIERRKKHPWPPHDTKDVDEIVPLPEKDLAATSR